MIEPVSFTKCRMTHIPWFLLALLTATNAQYTFLTYKGKDGQCKSWFIIYILDQKPSIWDEAVDRALGYLLSKFSSQTFEFTVGGIRLEAKLIGLDSVTRSCPIIMYDTEGGGLPGMRQFVRGCGDLPKLELVTKVLNTVSAFHLTEK